MKAYGLSFKNKVVWTNEDGHSPEPCSRCGGNSTNSGTTTKEGRPFPKGIEIIERYHKDTNRDFLYAVCQSCGKDYGCVDEAPKKEVASHG